MSTPPNPLTVLAERVERHEEHESSADLTADIYEALGYEVIRRPRNGRGFAWKYRGDGPLYNNARWVSMNWFASSFDAAAALKPVGCTFALGDCNQDDSPWACVTDAEGVDYIATGATPILALVAANLRARAASESPHG